jgi:hypothetical protein
LTHDATVADAPTHRTVGVHLVVHATDPVTGAVRVDGKAGETRFCGWIALMAIVNEACADLATPPQDPAVA